MGNTFAGVAKLADALVSGTSGRNTLWVQVPSPAPWVLLLEYPFLIRDLNGTGVNDSTVCCQSRA